MDFLQGMLAHAQQDQYNEVCGLVVARGKKVRLIQAENQATNTTITFDLDPAAWLQVQEGEEVIGIYHSHPSGTPEPSLADLTSCEISELPWHIVTPQGGYRRIEPSGFRAPYLRRPYVYGVHDCYAIVRDWYNWEWGLNLPNFHRDEEWWKKGQDLFMDNFEDCGFVEIADGEAKEGDAFLMQVYSEVPNHVAIYTGGGLILHHVRDRLSSKDPWGGYWRESMTNHLRHRTRLGA